MNTLEGLEAAMSQGDNNELKDTITTLRTQLAALEAACCPNCGGPPSPPFNCDECSPPTPGEPEEARLKREQPCGCVVCLCEDRCSGCGACVCGEAWCVFTGDGAMKPIYMQGGRLPEPQPMTSPSQ